MTMAQIFKSHCWHTNRSLNKSYKWILRKKIVDTIKEKGHQQCIISKKKIEEIFYWKKCFKKNEKDKQRVEKLERLEENLLAQEGY